MKLDMASPGSACMCDNKSAVSSYVSSLEYAVKSCSDQQLMPWLYSTKRHEEGVTMNDM